MYSQPDKTIEDLGDKVDAEEKEKAESAKEELNKALKAQRRAPSQDDVVDADFKEVDEDE